MMQQSSNRSGRYVAQFAGKPTEYKAFVPSALPPAPPIAMDDDLWERLSKADRAIGRLDGSTEALPNPNLFVMMYVRKEAVLSSQIEGTQASLAEVLEMEAEVLNPERPSDVAEVINYIAALNYGLERLKSLPLSLRLICEIHEKLMTGTRGQDKYPGQFRTTQNWIGPQNCSLKTARFVPPAIPDMKNSLNDLESFLHDEQPMPFLIRVGLAHAQFETIHPFLDGNGRIGRLMITFLMCEKGILMRPLLYLSYYFKQNRLEYYDRLQAVRDKGDWEGWIRFFLTGVASVANEATSIARKITLLREEDRSKIVSAASRTTSDAIKLYESLFDRPYVTNTSVQRLVEKEFPAAGRLITHLENLGILEEVTGRARGRVYMYRKYFKLFDDAEMEAQEVVSDEPIQETKF